MTESQSNNNRKLPVQRILILSFQLMKQRMYSFIRLGFPIIILALASILINLNDESAIMFLIQMNINPFFMVLILIFLWAIFIMVTVGCHRGFLLNDSGIQQTKTLRWKSREWRFLGWGLLIGLVVGLFLVVWAFVIAALGMERVDNSAITIISNQVISLPILYFFSRWSLIFPSIAVDDPNSNLTEAWWLSEGNGWRLTFLIIIVPLIIEIILSFISIDDLALLSIINTIIWLLVTLYQIGLLSLSYSFLKENHLQEEAEEDNNIESNNYEV